MRVPLFESEPRPLRIFMMDLLATVPYYTAYLSQALLRRDAELTVGSITYYLDPGCFRSRGLQTDPGALDLVGRFPLPALPRRVLKLVESVINLGALGLRFLWSRPDVLHVQYLPMLRWPVPLDLWFLHYCKRRGSKIALTCHDLLPHNTANEHQELFRRLYQFADAIICHSAAIESRLVAEFGVPADKISVIPHGPFFYDLPVTDAAPMLERFGVPRGVPLVLWQGIVSRYKGVDLLLEAWQAVEAAGSDAFLVVAGTGEAGLLETLREQARRLGLKRVRLHQSFISTEELVGLYGAADVVVYPYRAITTSGALATGLSFGKTILASDLPVFRELLVDGESASLVPAERAALAAGLLKLLADPAMRASFSAKVREMNFAASAWEQIATQTLSVYCRMADAASEMPAFAVEGLSLPYEELESRAGN